MKLWVQCQSIVSFIAYLFIYLHIYLFLYLLVCKVEAIFPSFLTNLGEFPPALLAELYVQHIDAALKYNPI